MRGGKRTGAGRPKIEDSKVVRVPKGCLDEVESIISLYKAKRGLKQAPIATPKISKSAPPKHPHLAEITESFDRRPRKERRQLIKQHGSKGAAIRWFVENLLVE